MKVYRTDEIRNVVLLGHGGSGKTSLAEAMAYVSGATNRMGKITDGNTISDFDKEEQKREFSISTSLIPIEWEKAKINILDTPGYFDFVGEVEEAVSAAICSAIYFPFPVALKYKIIFCEPPFRHCQAKSKPPVMLPLCLIAPSPKNIFPYPCLS